MIAAGATQAFDETRTWAFSMGLIPSGPRMARDSEACVTAFHRKVTVAEDTSGGRTMPVLVAVTSTLAWGNPDSGGGQATTDRFPARALSWNSPVAPVMPTVDAR